MADIDIVRHLLDQLPGLVTELGRLNALLETHDRRLRTVESRMERDSEEALARRVIKLEADFDKLLTKQDMEKFLERLGTVEAHDREQDRQLTSLRLQWAKLGGTATAGGGVVVLLQMLLEKLGLLTGTGP